MTRCGPVSPAPDPALVERFKQALDRLNPDGEKIGLAVSGGPDSMAMLLLAHAAIPGQFEVATVNHGLRAEAANECALVSAACAERGIPCAVLEVTVGAGNVQAMAREARYAALAEWVVERNHDALATAHHLDDQVETLLMRLNRGSGLNGLIGIREVVVPSNPQWAIGVIRPMLSFRRDELRAIVESAEIAVASDPSNEDERFDRVRIRQALAAADWLYPEAIATSVANLEDAADALDQMVEALERTHVRQRKGTWTLSPLMPPYCAFQLTRKIIEGLGGSPRGADVARLIDRLWQGTGGNVAGVLVTNEKGLWTFRPEPPRRTG